MKVSDSDCTLKTSYRKKISIDYDLYSDKLIKTSEIKCNIKTTQAIEKLIFEEPPE